MTLLAPTLRPARPALEVCHVPRGNLAQTKAVLVAGEGDLADHLAHGDTSFGVGLTDDCSGGVAVRIDPSIEPSTPSLEGIAGGPPRPVAVLVGPDGRRDEYVANEVDLKPEGAAELSAFLAQYGGGVLRDDVVLFMTDEGELVERPGNGWYLLRVDPTTSQLEDLPTLLSAQGAEGTFSFSSEAAARSFALALREVERKLSLNLVLQPQVVSEHPLVTSPASDADYLDFATLPYMTDDEDPDGLSIGVVRAWEYLRQLGLPPAEGFWRPARVAVIDDGFSLDPVTGLGNADYLFQPPLQIDVLDSNARAGGAESEGTWHGERVLGVCCATPRNRFGGAGRGGEYVRPIAIRAAWAWSDVATGIWSSIEMQANVINVSSGGNCSWWCDLIDEPGQLEEAIAEASARGIAVLAAAGNGLSNEGPEDLDISDNRFLPCKISSVICVGAIGSNDDSNVWNWGSGVDIWAPLGTFATVTPLSAGMDFDDVDMDEVATIGGTSGATPFAAGVVGLIKTIDPSLRWDAIQQILQDTANPSSDSKVVRGYVDALRAVQAVRGNPAPSVSFASPVDGSSHSWNRFPVVLVDVEDPPYPHGFTGRLVVESDRDGVICDLEDTTTRFRCEFQPSSSGRHVLTATASDPFGATNTATLSVEVTNGAPAVAIFSPGDGRTFLTGQPIRFTAEVSDFDETIEDDQITWSSSLDGDITPPNSPRDFTRMLSAGTHAITLTAVDGLGESASDEVSISVVSGSTTPVAQIAFPPDGGILRRSETLLGAGFDPEDGELSGASLEWHGSVDGFLGTGSPLTVTFSGAQTLTLRAIDSDGNVGTDQISFTIGPD
jgi:hypothetical protein